jgi:hypothetical protein
MSYHCTSWSCHGVQLHRSGAMHGPRIASAAHVLLQDPMSATGVLRPLAQCCPRISCGVTTLGPCTAEGVPAGPKHRCRVAHGATAASSRAVHLFTLPAGQSRHIVPVKEKRGVCPRLVACALSTHGVRCSPKQMSIGGHGYAVLYTPANCHLIEEVRNFISPALAPLMPRMINVLMHVPQLPMGLILCSNW